MLTELYDHLSKVPPESDAPAVNSTHEYLSACNLLFERGLLSHGKISKTERDTLDRIRKGYSFFTTWLQSLLDAGK